MNPINMMYQSCNVKYINGAVVVIVTTIKDPEREC